jgi:hypothetical protein
VKVDVDTPDPQAPALVVVVEVCIVRPGTTRTSSTKSATDLYVLTDVVHGVPFAKAVVIVAVFVEVLNAPVRSALWVRPALVVVTEAAVGYVRQTTLGAGPDGPEGPAGLPPLGGLPEHRAPPAPLLMTSTSTKRLANRLLFCDMLFTPSHWPTSLNFCTRFPLFSAT